MYIYRTLTLCPVKRNSDFITLQLFKGRGGGEQLLRLAMLNLNPGQRSPRPSTHCMFVGDIMPRIRDVERLPHGHTERVDVTGGTEDLGVRLLTRRMTQHFRRRPPDGGWERGRVLPAWRRRGAMYSGTFTGRSFKLLPL